MSPAEPVGTEPVGWQQYTALLRELDQLRIDRLRSEQRRGERPDGPDRRPVAEARPVAGTGSLAALRAEAARVGSALDDQAEQLRRLARLLRVRRPDIPQPEPDPAAETTDDDAADGPHPDPGDDPFVLLEQAVGQAQRSAELANQAERRARRPRLLPGLAPGVRNLLVYLGCALVALLVQVPLVSDPTGDPSGLAVLVVIPGAAFLVGWLVITVFGRSRLPSAAERVRVGPATGPDPGRRSVRLGLTLCFLAFPVTWLVLVVSGRLQR